MAGRLDDGAHLANCTRMHARIVIIIVVLRYYYLVIQMGNLVIAFHCASWIYGREKMAHLLCVPFMLIRLHLYTHVYIVVIKKSSFNYDRKND